MRQFQRVPTTHDTEKNKVSHFESNACQVSGPLQHVKLLINVKIPVNIWQIVYINMMALSSNLI